jgi:hypothetical protein
MQHYRGIALLALTTTAHASLPPDDEALPPIQPGAFAAWARAAEIEANRTAAPGTACRLPDGRKGRLIEVIHDGGVLLVCQPA